MAKRVSKKIKRKPEPVTARSATATEQVASPWNNGFDRVTRVIDTVTVMYRRKQIDQRQLPLPPLWPLLRSGPAAPP